MFSIHLIEFRKHSKVFFGVIVVGDGRFLFILENSNVLVTDVYQPLAAMFETPLYLSVLFICFLMLLELSALVAHLRLGA